MGLPPDVAEPLGAVLTRMPTTDIESQTDPVTRAPAANAAGHDNNEVPYTYNHVVGVYSVKDELEALMNFMSS